MTPRLWQILRTFCLLATIAGHSPPPSLWVLSFAFAGQKAFGQSQDSTEMPVKALSHPHTALDCDAVVEIIAFSRKFHINSQSSNEELSVQKTDQKQSVISHYNALMNPLGLYLNAREHTTMAKAVGAFFDNPSNCHQLQQTQQLFTQGAVRYLTYLDELSEPPNPKKPPVFSPRELESPFRSSEAMKRKFEKIARFEAFYLNLQAKRRSDIKIIPHYQWIKQTYTRGDFHDYAEQLFAMPRIYALFIKAYLRSLDRYSTFYSQKEFIQSRFFPYPTTSKNHVGVGITATVPHEFLKISTIEKQSPAYKIAKLSPQDSIIAIYDPKSKAYVSTFSLAMIDMIRLLKGQKGTHLQMFVVSQQPVDNSVTQYDLLCEELSLQRDWAAEIHPSNVKAKTFEVVSENQNTTIGWIQPSRFYRTIDPRTSRLVSSLSVDTIRELQKMNLGSFDALVLDLRDNPGGKLSEALLMHRLFSRQSHPWTFEGSFNRSFVDNKQTLTRSLPTIYQGPLVVAVNQATASAAENLAHSFQALSRALIVGEPRTAGKGLMQSLVYLNKNDPDLGAVLLSTHRLKPTSGKSLDNLGLESDIVISGNSSGTSSGNKPARRRRISATSATKNIIHHHLETASLRRRKNQPIATSNPMKSGLLNSSVKGVCRGGLKPIHKPSPSADKFLTEVLKIASDYSILLKDPSFKPPSSYQIKEMSSSSQ